MVMKYVATTPEGIRLVKAQLKMGFLGFVCHNLSKGMLWGLGGVLVIGPFFNITSFNIPTIITLFILYQCLQMAENYSKVEMSKLFRSQNFERDFKKVED